ncbi:MAG: hypothetical protein EF811_05535 [Methanonatronarchaeia archaeon]|nr:MAG: hypothetical protein EF811_05535 [Methanonatronarchaeia archaeon]
MVFLVFCVGETSIDRIGIVVPDWGSLNLDGVVSVVGEFWDTGVSEVVLGFPGAPGSLKSRVEGLLSGGGKFCVVCKTGRDEVLSSVRKVCGLVKREEVDVDSVDEGLVDRFMESGGDLDILIKVGEKRLPNSIFWSVSYSEIFFVDSFDELEGSVSSVIEEFEERERRFGR